jgi:cell division protein FtsQ
MWLAAVAAAAAYWVLFHTNYFLITGVTVKGATRVSQDAVLKRAHVTTGTPLAALKAGPGQADIGSLPQVKNVTIERLWPHTVLITITERVPVATAHYNGRYVEVDDQGVPASNATAAPAAGVVAIDGKPGTPAMQAAVEVIRALPSAWKLAAVTADTMDSVTVTLTSGVRIVFGSGEAVGQKVSVATALMANKYRRIDVSAPDAPTVRK